MLVSLLLVRIELMLWLYKVFCEFRSITIEVLRDLCPCLPYFLNLLTLLIEFVKCNQMIILWLICFSVTFDLTWVKYVCRAASIPRSKGGTFLQMKLVYNQLAPIFLFLLQWIDCSSSCLLASYLNLFDIVICKVGFCLAVHMFLNKLDLFDSFIY